MVGAMNKMPQDTKKVFMKKGSCSQALCFLMNRDFGCHTDAGEKAADPFAGGLLMRGHQCGMLWGSSLAVGGECHRRFSDSGLATAVAIATTGRLVESYAQRAGSVNCRDVCGHDFTKKTHLAIFMIKFILHINRYCLDLAEQWFPEAVRAAAEGLSAAPTYSLPPMSCASVVAKRMGASDEEAVMVAGFAGGLGLSGNGCGALAAAVWMKTLGWSKQNPGKSAYNNPAAKSTLQAFMDANGSRFICRELCGRTFASVDDHAEFLQAGGCRDVIESLART